MHYYFTLEEQWQWLGSNTKRSKPSRCTKPSIFLTVQHVVPIWIEFWVTKLKIWVTKPLHSLTPAEHVCLSRRQKNFLYLEQSWHAVAFSPGTASRLYLLVSQGQDSLLAQTKRDGWYPHCRTLPGNWRNIETDSNADYWAAFSVFLKCSALCCHREAYQIQFLMCLYYNYHMLSDFFIF